ncbi:SPOR domain-containing protein [Sphingomonas ginkgonis]|uniref:SPOR domain-containing protein n=1 Tax=Sphingomonas ginkgonis TaxID=2315330 RepID=A0A429VD62_9SPHN|nr:SPOR domain-containing protein [Sphingomonas ginkgonis]RST31811.1 SPOR domain-containing protein [Sphingomonas ginkgonis]
MNVEERELPWLAAVDDEDEPRGLSARKMFAAILVVLLGAGLVAGTLFWLARDRDGSGPPELIRAQPGPYKVASNDKGSLDVAGDSVTAFSTSAGEDQDSQLDLNAVPEAPIARPQPTPQTTPPNETKAPATDAPEKVVATPPAGGAGSVIQLGAYARPAQAEAAWKALSSRFPTIAAMTKIVIPATVNGGTVYRLRAGAASSADARAACQTLKVAGENCLPVN